MLTLFNVNKKLGKNNILKSLSLELEKKTYGLLGPNGAGKTTLLRCITTLYPVDSGEICFNGEKVSKVKDYPSNIGYLPQKFGMYKELTSLEMLQLLATLKGIPVNEIQSEAERCIQLVGLEDKMNSKVKTLSGGMVRRLGIAQALLGSPEILVFDEPTAGLDPEERMRFKNIIAKLNGKHTIIISTHIVTDVEDSCDEILVMNKGEILAKGDCDTIRQIAKNKVYKIPNDKLEQLIEPYFIQRTVESEGVKCTIVLSAVNQPNAISIAPNVEDGYICATKEI